MKKMRFFKDRRGSYIESIVSIKFMFLPTMFLLFMLMIVFLTRWNVWYLKNEILDDMEKQGGYNVAIENRVKQLCADRKLDYGNLSINATQGVRNYGERLDLEIAYSYRSNWVFNFTILTVKEKGHITSEYFIR